MVRVIWAKLSGWTDVGESLDLILDLSVAAHVLHHSVALIARSGCVCCTARSCSWLGRDACVAPLSRDVRVAQFGHPHGSVGMHVLHGLVAM